MKIQDYNGGEIQKNRNGNYVFVKGKETSVEYASVALLVHDNPEKESTSGEQATETKTTARTTAARKTKK